MIGNHNWDGMDAIVLPKNGEKDHYGVWSLMNSYDSFVLETRQNFKLLHFH